jgi:hypothetical protein
MALQLRRGLDGAGRLAITPGIGEIIYTTDTKKVYVGDGTTAGGNPVSPVVSVNALTGAVVLNADNILEAVGSPTNLYFTTERAQDAAAAMLVAGTHSGITFTYGSTQDGANRIDATVAASSSVISSGTTNSLGYYAANGTTLSPSSSLLWSETSNLLSNVNGTFQITANNSGRATLIQDSYNNSSTQPNSLLFRKARGTNISPTALGIGDIIHSIIWQGYDGTAWQNSAYINTVLVANPTAGIVPTHLLFYVADAAGADQPVARFANDGQVSFGPTQVAEGGSGRVIIRQTTAATGAPAMRIDNFYSDAIAPTISFVKGRGTFGSPAAVQASDALMTLAGRGYYNGSTAATAGLIQITASTAPGATFVPGQIRFSTTNGSGVSTLATTIDHTQLLTHNGSMSVSGSLTHSGLKIGVPNYITVGSTGTFVLSTTVSTNILLVTAGALTATLTFPSSPVDGQVCQFSVHTNTVTLALTAGPTLSGTFAGSVTAPTTFTYIYRATGTTWYKVQ